MLETGVAFKRLLKYQLISIMNVNVTFLNVFCTSPAVEARLVEMTATATENTKITKLSDIFVVPVYHG